MEGTYGIAGRVGVSGDFTREKPQKGKCRREEMEAGPVHCPASCDVHPKEEITVDNILLSPQPLFA